MHLSVGPADESSHYKSKGRKHSAGRWLLAEWRQTQWTFLHMQVYACVCIYMQVYVCMHVYASLACVCMCMHACMLMQVCMYVCMHLRPKLLRISPINPTSNVPMHILGCPWEVFCLPDLCSISYYRRFCLRYPTPSLKGDYPKIES